jgi:hypothetical protein
MLANIAFFSLVSLKIEAQLRILSNIEKWQVNVQQQSRRGLK